MDPKTQKLTVLVKVPLHQTVNRATGYASTCWPGTSADENIVLGAPHSVLQMFLFVPAEFQILSGAAMLHNEAFSTQLVPHSTSVLCSVSSTVTMLSLFRDLLQVRLLYQTSWHMNSISAIRPVPPSKIQSSQPCRSLNESKIDQVQIHD